MKTFTVTLLKPHTHAGVRYPAGAEISVNESDFHYLKDRHLITSKSTKTADVVTADQNKDSNHVSA